MKAYLINMHLLVPRSRSSAKVKVKYKGYISQKKAVSGAFVFHKHILFCSVFTSFEIIVGKGETDGKHCFLLFSSMFSIPSKKTCTISETMKFLSVNAFSIEKS